MSLTKDAILENKTLKLFNPAFSGELKDSRKITINKDKGVHAIFDVVQKKVASFEFDETQWTLDEAAAFVEKNRDIMQEMHIKASILRDDKQKGMVAIASEEVEDRHGEVVSISGWDLENFKSNPVILWNHGFDRSVPIGKATSIGFRTIDGKKKMVFALEFETVTQFGREMKQLVEEGFLNAFSVGFIPFERDGNIYTKQELLEISLVAVPALASALFIQRAKSLGISNEVIEGAIEQPALQTVPAFRSYRKADESTKWDARSARNRIARWAEKENKEIDFDKLKVASTYVDTSKSTKLSSYRLTHHDIQDGELVTVFAGVSLAMAELMGAGDGVNMTDAEKKAAYDHLAQHYKEFDREAPPYEYVQNKTLKSMFDAVAEDMDQRNTRDVKRAIKSIRQDVRQKRSNLWTTSDINQKASPPISAQDLADVMQTFIQAAERAHVVAKKIN